MRGPNLDEIEGNFDGEDHDLGDLLDRLDEANGTIARLEIALESAHTEIVDLSEQVDELRQELGK